jgi:hypothetical protein
VESSFGSFSVFVRVYIKWAKKVV